MYYILVAITNPNPFVTTLKVPTKQLAEEIAAQLMRQEIKATVHHDPSAK